MKVETLEWIGGGMTQKKIAWVPIKLNAQGRCPACEDAYQEYLAGVIDPRD